MADIRVGESINFAMIRTGTVLFRPFRFGRYATIAFIATLMLAGEGGGGSIRFPTGGGGGGGPGPGPGGGGGPSFDEVTAWIKAHLVLIIAAVVVAAIILFAIYCVLRWISSRGHMMLYDAVVKNSDNVRTPWVEMRTLGNSLFKFRIVYDLLIFNVFLLILVIGGGLAWPDIKQALINERYALTAWTVAAIIFTICSLTLASIALWFVHGVVFGIGVPIMYIRNMTAWPAMKLAWREIVRPHLGASLLYMLFRIVIGMVSGLWAFMGLLVLLLITCCTISCVQIIPVIGNYPLAFVLLPMLVYERAYALHFVSQFGPEYQVGWSYAGEHGFPVEVTPPLPPSDPFP